MSEVLPGWLEKALMSGPDTGPDTGASKDRGAAAGLAIAQLVEERNFARGGFKLTSPAFDDGEALDPCFTADEEDAVAPPLEWNPPPPGAQEIVIIAEDIDAGIGGKPKAHWLVWGLPGQKGKLLEGEAPPRVGKNGQGNSEWLLPSIPEGDPAHRFVFQIFALELPLTLMPGASRDELMAQMRGNVTSAALLNTAYAGYEDDQWDDDDENGDDG